MIVRCLDLLKRMCSFIGHSFILTGRTDIYFTEAVLIVNPTPVDLRFVVASSGRMCIRFPLPSKNPHRRIGFRWAQRIGITTLAATSILPCDHMVPVLSGSLLTFHIPKINGFFFCLDIWFVRPQWDEVASRGNVTRHFEGKDLFADLFYPPPSCEDEQSSREEVTRSPCVPSPGTERLLAYGPATCRFANTTASDRLHQSS